MSSLDQKDRSSNIEYDAHKNLKINFYLP